MFGKTKNRNETQYTVRLTGEAALFYTRRGVWGGGHTRAARRLQYTLGVTHAVDFRWLSTPRPLPLAQYTSTPTPDSAGKIIYAMSNNFGAQTLAASWRNGGVKGSRFSADHFVAARTLVKLFLRRSVPGTGVSLD